MFPFAISASDSCLLTVSIIRNNDTKSPAPHIDRIGYMFVIVGKRAISVISLSRLLKHWDVSKYSSSQAQATKSEDCPRNTLYVI